MKKQSQAETPPAFICTYKDRVIISSRKKICLSKKCWSILTFLVSLPRDTEKSPPNVLYWKDIVFNFGNQIAAYIGKTNKEILRFVVTFTYPASNFKQNGADFARLLWRLWNKLLGILACMHVFTFRMRTFKYHSGLDEVHDYSMLIPNLANLIFSHGRLKLSHFKDQLTL